MDGLEPTTHASDVAPPREPRQRTWPDDRAPARSRVRLRSGLPSGVSRDLSRVKWIAIVAPLVFLVGVQYLIHSELRQLHDPPGAWLLLLGLALTIGIFSFVVFGIMGRLERHILEQNRLLVTANEISTASARNLEPDKLLSAVLDRLLAAVGADAGFVNLVEPESGRLVAFRRQGLSARVADELGERDGEAGRGLAGGEADGRLIDLFADRGLTEAARSEGIRSAYRVAIGSRGQANAELVVGFRRKDGPTGDDLELLRNVAGQLGLAFRNAVVFDMVTRRNLELAALLRVGRAASSSLELRAILDKAVDTILDVTSAEAAEVWLRDERDGLLLECQRGLAEDAFRERRSLKLGEGLPGIAAKTGRPLLVHDLPTDDRFLRGQVKELGFHSYCALPLRHRGETVGILGVAARDREALCDDAEHGLLEGIGERLAMAVENCRLHGRVLDGAVLEERERIARELHDGLAQVLGYINTRTLAVRKLVASGREEEAGRELRDMEEATRQVYGDVREAILGLRDSLPTAGGLVESLHKYLSDYGEMTGLALDLDVDGPNGGLGLSAESQIQLMRVIQEALSNVRKHARANRATVKIISTAGEVRVEVEDDGCGFTPDRTVRTGWPHFGLQTMRERAEAIGGQFDVVASSGRGTTVSVRVPLAQPEAAVGAGSPTSP